MNLTTQLIIHRPRYHMVTLFLIYHIKDSMIKLMLKVKKLPDGSQMKSQRHARYVKSDGETL